MVEGENMEQRVQDIARFSYEPTAPLVDSTIARPGLELHLDAGLQRPLMLVTGPAGAGKTTAVQNWMRMRALQKPAIIASWITLEETHNDAELFWQELIRALRQLQRPHSSHTLFTIDEKTLSYPNPDSKAGIASFLTSLSAETGQEIVIIFDNYQEIQEKTVQRAVLSLVEHASSHIHFVLISRVDPPLPLARWHVQEKLAEVEAEQLRFSRDEAALFALQSLGRVINSEIIDELHQRTEGWAAGLKLALLAMQTKTSQASMKAYVKSFSGSDHYVARYLEEEVFAPLAEDTQRFLLFTSILEQMHGELCDAITEREDSFAMLESFHRSHLFVHLLENYRYRYDRFFVELLRARLYQLHPQIIDTLHQRASVWYEQHALHEDALKHRLAITRRQTQYEKNHATIFFTDTLSDRELMVLNLIARGLSNQEVARTLVVSISTVKTHLNSIYEKLHVHTRLQAVNRGYELQLLRGQEPAS